MLDNILAANLACLDAVVRLSKCDLQWSDRVEREFGITGDQLEALHAAIDGESAQRRSLRERAQIPFSLFNVRSDRLDSALNNALRGVDYFGADSRLSRECQMAVQQYAAALTLCCKENGDEAAVRFSITKNCVFMIQQLSAHDVANAMMANGIVFTPSNNFIGAFSAVTSFERTRYVLREVSSFLKMSKVDMQLARHM